MKILIIRFSSFGDVLQTLSVAGKLGESLPQAEIHWVTRQEFVPLIENHPRVNRVWSLPKGAKLKTVFNLGRELRDEGFTHIYDAHNNLRSHVLSFCLNGFLGWRLWVHQHQFLRRSIYRWKRFLLFRMRRNLFPKPFSGQFALLEPLKKWGLNSSAPQVPQLFLKVQSGAHLAELLPDSFARYVALAPSAAFELKRWPLEYWQSLTEMMPGTKFVVLGGPEDGFLKKLERPGQVLNLAGRLSLLESAQVIQKAQALVANDTGLMHVAEQAGVPCLALMGPAPFGFPSRPATKIFELDLACRPCSKHGQGPCVNPEFHKCLRGIHPQSVAQALRRIVHAELDATLSQ
jgi:ADP-heptose:LPS heptosyltransferase